ncbi:MAG: lysophospholipid acyltransferase family protein [Candidatus Omnitrophica bacterium]|nr:lysophospholipid acyltransferase family protein [Candidatus Omnitrophota bacterium]MDD5042345.1 lysophospholipid acyltransferase family protein [Candidatus Omnitrophota bacterium]MDD5500902.1 lysophospholipid acyltransferase family protein [Candidatus Omnitrophota bacterium]
MKQSISSIGIWIVGATLIIVLFLVMAFLSLILYPFDKKRRIVHAQCFWWADALIAFNPYWDVQVGGLENIDHKRTYVVVSNHQSLADIVLMYKTKMQFKWVAKDALFKIPILGWNMRLARHIRLKRGNLSSIKRVYKEAGGWLRKKVSVVFFPEGTRSDNDGIGEFQNGAFKLAIKEKVPILPVLIEGTRNAIPKGSWRFTTKRTCAIKVFPPIETLGLAASDFIRLREQVKVQLS